MQINKTLYFKKYDTSFFIIATIIFFIGVLNIYAGIHLDTNSHTATLYQRQIFLYFIAITIGIVTSFIKPKMLYQYSYIIYFLNLILLILVLLIGDQSMGAKRWLSFGSFRMQPSELMKLSVILALARWYSNRTHYSSVGFKELIVPSLMVMVPILLIVVEPDLGTGLIIVFIFGVISFYKNLKWKTLIIILFLSLISSFTMYKFGLKEYQKSRIASFINPGDDVKGSGYNAHQSKIAIGSGKLFGKGFKKSSQASLNYLPENHTDFVFSVFNEEHGFFGSLVLITLYLILLFKFIHLATSVSSLYQSIICIGIMSIFFWHTIINMAMTTGMLPIVGLPLPLMSYGGSNLLTMGICLGIATGINNSRILF